MFSLSYPPNTSDLYINKGLNSVVKSFLSIDKKWKSKKRFVAKTPRLYKFFYRSLFVLNLRNFHQCLQKESQLGIVLLNFNNIIVHKKGVFCGRWFTATLLENNVNRFGTQFFYPFCGCGVCKGKEISKSSHMISNNSRKYSAAKEDKLQVENQSLRNGIWYWVSGCFTGDVSS